MGSNAHIVWFDKSVPVSAADDHDPYGDEELEESPLVWDTNTVYTTNPRLSGLGQSPYITDSAKPYQGSYWPNEPPVLAPDGFYWYDYGSVGRDMRYWRAIPIGTRPSPEDQSAALAKHREAFANGNVPEGLREALAQHGLALPESRAAAWFGSLFVYTFVIGALGVLFRVVGIKKRG